MRPTQLAHESRPSSCQTYLLQDRADVLIHRAHLRRQQYVSHRRPFGLQGPGHEHLQMCIRQLSIRFTGGAQPCMAQLPPSLCGGTP
jgi:hypothetical protein